MSPAAEPKHPFFLVATLPTPVPSSVVSENSDAMFFFFFFCWVTIKDGDVIDCVWSGHVPLISEFSVVKELNRRRFLCLDNRRSLVRSSKLIHDEDDFCGFETEVE